MDCDLVVALAQAGVDGQTLFGRRSNPPSERGSRLHRIAGRAFAPGEKVRTQFLELPQTRQTHAVLGCQPDCCWGYEHGVNEYQVAMGCLALAPALQCNQPGLLGTELTRLALERSPTARQAVNLLTSLVERYGQGAFPGCPAVAARDHAFLIVDPMEAYAVETTGHHWVYQEVQEVRAVTNARVIRQDWDRISHGLASYAISQGWWPDDGSKLDFAGALEQEPGLRAAALRRWGQNTLRLMEQSGHIDVGFLRHLLDEAYEESARSSGPPTVLEPGDEWDIHFPGEAGPCGPAGFIVSLTRDPARLPTTWCALGTPSSSLYFPLLLDGELPAPFTDSGQPPSTASFWTRLSRLNVQLEHDAELRMLVRDHFARLQACFDQEAEEFNVEGAALKRRGAWSDLHRQATLFMQYNWERFEGLLSDALHARPLVAVES
jgi:dipeptidase